MRHLEPVQRADFRQVVFACAMGRLKAASLPAEGSWQLMAASSIYMSASTACQACAGMYQAAGLLHASHAGALSERRRDSQ